MKTRDDEIVCLRKKGWVLLHIGNKFGLTRERVRQILVGRKVTKRSRIPGYVRLLDVAKECRRSSEYIGRIRNIRGIKITLGQIRESDAKVLIDHFAQPCQICWKRMRRTTSCNFKVHSHCVTTGWRMKNIPGYREKHYTLMADWRRKNPEKLLSIQRRASSKYHRRHKALSDAGKP